jgi:hypothetical protein
MMPRSVRGGEKRVVSRIAALIPLLALTASIGRAADAQVAPVGACPMQPIEDARFGVRYLPCQLTNPPVLQVDTVGWHYPEIMRSAGISGRVRATFIVDTTGRYLPGSMRALSSSHDIFSNAAKIGLSRARFSPGRRDGRAVAVELIHDFVFTLPAGIELQELEGVPSIASLIQAPARESIPVLDIRPDAEDPTLGPPPGGALRDSIAHESIRVVARALGWDGGIASVTAKPPRLLLCVHGDTSVFESTADGALATAMTRPNVRVMTQRGCPPTRDQMVALPPELQPHYPPDSVPFIEPHRLHVARVAMRRGGGPQVELVDEYMLGEEEYRCVRVSRASSIFALRCVRLRSIVH